MTQFLTNGTVGAKLDAVNAESQFSLGETALGSDGTVWVYVQANGAITQYDCVAIDENYQAAAITAALAGDGHQVGFAQVAFADNEYGWVALRGSNISVRVAQSCAADTLLRTSGTAGVLDDASTASSVKVKGATIVTAGGTGTTAREVIAGQNTGIDLADT